jgi:hypothetical protein
MPTMSLKLWTIYERPAEYPNLYVARESEVGGEKNAPRTKRLKFSSDLSALRKQMEQLGLTRYARDSEEQPYLLEVWTRAV